MDCDSGSADLAIVGGTVVTNGWAGEASVIIDDGRIRALIEHGGLESPVGSRRVIDAKGKFVLPGAVDPHCHVASRHGEFRTLDNFESASRAALFGGTTTIIDFAIPARGEDPVDALKAKLEMGQLSRCDYALHGCIASAESDVESIVREFAAAGVRTVKLFTTYRGELLVGVDTIERVMKALKKVSGLLYVHAEANDIVEAAQVQAARDGFVRASGMSRTRPAAAEEQAVREVLAAAERTTSPVYFVHQSIPGAVDQVVAARQRGVHAFSESCPHYLVLDDSRYDGDHPERFVCCPPLRGRSIVEALESRLVMGFVHTIGSDHCCYDTEQKLLHSEDVRAMPNGLPGVETRLTVIWDALVHSGKVSPERFVEVVASNAARLNGLYPRKGSIAPGSDADVILLDPAATRRLHANELHMATDYTPYEGRAVTGIPTTVIAQGRVVMTDGEYVDPGPIGRFVSSRPIVV